MKILSGRESLTGNPSDVADALGSFNQTARAPCSIKETVSLAGGVFLEKLIGAAQ